mmetsp:Transcript_28318/g.60720  ORF Transcript_28318/g.60720 Transcript_28318/m.60720 type:complete len:302 (-) Transcript_28318:451-1356(-)
MYRFFVGATALVLLLPVVPTVATVEASACDVFSGLDRALGTADATLSLSFSSGMVETFAGFGGVGAVAPGWMTSSLGGCSFFFLGAFGLLVALTLASPWSFPSSIPICCRMSILKFIMSPLYLVMVRSSQIQISFATWLINRMSWLTKTRPPSNSLTALASASMPSMSRWFVGSSRSKMWGTSRPSLARTTLDFCPSESSSILRICMGPLTPKRPRYLRCSSRGSLGYRLSKNSRGVISRSRTSTKCWVKRPSLRCPWGRMSPRDGFSSPAMSLTRVVLPAPLGPTSATLESRSTPKLTFL